MADKRAETMSLSGNDYAKVAERIKLFKQDHPKGKIETDHTNAEDGTVEFKTWLWKDKAELIELIKAGVTDKEVLRSSADSDGDAKGNVGVKTKDFEKLQTISVGRALANLGYLGNGEVASSEEMELYLADKKDKELEAINEAVGLIKASEDIDALKKVFMGLGSLMANGEVIKAKDRRKLELKAEQIKKEKESK